MQLVEMDAIPAGENPFWHDSLSVGLNVGNMLPVGKINEEMTPLDDVYIMSSGFFNTRYDFYIVNKKTGERKGIKL